MFDDDLTTTIVKCAVMIVVILAEYWMMQPYNEPILPRFWQALARLCYKIARKFGEFGLRCEFEYFQVIP